MALVSPNCTFDVYRSIFITGKGTQNEQIYASGVIGHLQNIPGRHVRMSQNSAVNILYELRIDFGGDVTFFDIIKNIQLTWTGMLIPALTQGIQTWRVIDAYDTTPGPLAYRTLIIERVIAGGPAPL